MVAAAAVAILAISWFGPRPSSRPSLDGLTGLFATPEPTPFPTAAQFATALPALTGGAGRFTGTVGVVSNNFRVLDLGTGETLESVNTFFDDDVVVPVPGGAGWLCICIAGGSVQDVQLVLLDPAGHELDRRTIGRLGTTSGPDRSIAVRTGIDLAPDRRTGLLVAAVQGPSEWTYSVASLDLAAGTSGPQLALGTQRPPDVAGSVAPVQAFAVGPFVRLAPGGDRAWVWAATLNAGDPLETQSVGWTIRLEHGQPVAVSPVGDLAGPTICVLGGFLAPDQFVAMCESPGHVEPEWSIREFAADGGLTRRVDVTDVSDFSSDMLFDTANGAIWVWNGSAMHLRRIDAATGSVAEMTFDRDAETASGGEPLDGAQPVWVRPDAIVPSPFDGQMTGSRDGSRLYLLGYAQEPGPLDALRSLGILVVDPRTMALLGRWSNDAAYDSIHMGFGGSVVMASGMSGFDDRGEPSFWEASVTFHDAEDGRILARYGRLGEFRATIIEP